jgi:AcrR family transcriptional regulator
VFLRRGFHASSLDLVADEAGFTKGAVYSRFRSKADLFLALLEERIASRIGEMRNAVADAHGALTVATALGRQWDQKLSQDESWSLLLIEVPPACGPHPGAQSPLCDAARPAACGDRRADHGGRRRNRREPGAPRGGHRPRGGRPRHRRRARSARSTARPFRPI